ncbi:Malonyl-[acyl-carrier protein] O-methyltransferase [Anaerolineales bacterium]|nr:Malonyl-[acyl-carrier protein] O-methyltransferase [Anaerolineales bacterium]
MEPQEYGLMFEVETAHWWYLGMEKITRATLNQWYSVNFNSSVLDAGCGTGAAMSTYLADYGHVTGIDVSPLALGFCRKRNLTSLALASVTNIPFPPESFDLVTSFDVLYEQAVRNDLAALDEFFRVLRPGGLTLLRLPAYDWLRGQHDLTIHTARRYTVPQVTQLLKDSGFQPLRVTYANTFLFPLALAKRLLERIFPPDPSSSDLSVNVGMLNGLFKHVLASEAFFVSRIGLPFGLSVIALARKPQTA